jgi:hypothetical protein
MFEVEWLRILQAVIAWSAMKEQSLKSLSDSFRLLTRLFKSPFQETNMAVDQGHGKPT